MTVGFVNGTLDAAGLTLDNFSNSMTSFSQGSFTPTISFGGASVGVVYNAQFGRYTKINNMVIFTAIVDLTDKGSSVGAALIEGLPFTNSGTGQPVSLQVQGVTSAPGLFQANVTGAAATINLQSLDAATGAIAALDDTNFAVDANVYVQGVYFTA